MLKHYKLNIPTPCHEDWSEMTPTQRGKFCDQCKTEVIDLTQMTPLQISNIIKTNPQGFCGRMNSEMPSIYSVEHQNRNAGFQITVASLAILASLSAYSSPKVFGNNPQELVLVEQNEGLPKEERVRLPNDSVHVVIKIENFEDDSQHMQLVLSMEGKGIAVFNEEGEARVKLPYGEPLVLIIQDLSSLEKIQVVVNSQRSDEVITINLPEEWRHQLLPGYTGKIRIEEVEEYPLFNPDEYDEE